jgi:hypothetical protein
MGSERRSGPCSDMSGGHLSLAFGINEFWIEIDPAIPFDRIECNPDLFESLIVFDSLKYAKTKNGLHVQNAGLSKTTKRMKSPLRTTSFTDGYISLL